MKKLIAKVKKFLKQTNILIILIVIFLTLFITTIIVNSIIQRSNQPDNQNNQDFVQIVQQNNVPTSNFPEVKSLIDSLPYQGEEFFANKLPLEEGKKPFVLVEIQGPNGRVEFLQWAAQLEFDPFEVTIEILSNEPLHGTYGDV